MESRKDRASWGCGAEEQVPPSGHNWAPSQVSKSLVCASFYCFVKQRHILNYETKEYLPLLVFSASVLA